MTNIINLLLSKDLPHKAKKLQDAAISIYDSAFKVTAKKAEARGRGRARIEFGADDFTPELAKMLAKMLSGVNLLDKKQYMKIYTALGHWKFKKPWAEDVEEEKEIQQLGKMHRVKTILADHLLPALLKQQMNESLQKDRLRKEALKNECLKYYEHLAAVLEKEYKKNKPDPESLRLIKAKKRVIEGLHNTLRTKNEKVSQQLENFKGLLKENKDLLATRRDSTEMIIFKSIVTILSLGTAYAFGLWSTEGGKTREKMASILEATAANDPHLKPLRRKLA